MIIKVISVQHPEATSINEDVPILLNSPTAAGVLTIRVVPIASPLTANDTEWARIIAECNKVSTDERVFNRTQAVEKVKKAGYDYETMKEQVLNLYE